MANFFYNLGSLVGSNLRKANWLFRSLAGTEAESIGAEHAVGKDLAREWLRGDEADPDPNVQKFLDAVSGRLTACVANPHRTFLFRALRGAEVNAFALPGGFIFVRRALLEFCRWDQDEIAFVLGHEMGHVLARHTMERLLASSMVRGAMLKLPVGGLLAAPVLHAASSLIQQGYSQDQELEADSLGAKLTHCSGYDPRAALRLFAKLGVAAAEAPLGGYFSSHPPAHVRTDRLHRYLKEAERGTSAS